MYYDTIKKRVRHIYQMLANDSKLDVSLNQLDFCNKYIDVGTVMETINPELEYISSGGYGHTFYGSSVEHDVEYALKMVGYNKNPKFGDITNPCRPENCEIQILILLAKLVTEGMTPHIVLIVSYFTTSIQPFIEIKDDLSQHERYMKFYADYSKGVYYPDVSILISEWADRGDLSKFLNRKVEKDGKTLKQIDLITTEMWRVLLFQLISCLATIHGRYPDFRHNDLKANNVLVQKLQPSKVKEIFKYKINKNRYFVPSIGVILKIWDFDFACIKGVVDNIKVSGNFFAKTGNVTQERHQYYDIHYFLNTLERFVDNFYERIPDEIREFIFRVIPPDYRGAKAPTSKFLAERGRLLSHYPYTTPLEIIEDDPLFEPFRLTDEQISNISILTE